MGATMLLIRLIFLMLASVPMVHGSSCRVPGTLSESLRPGMVAFVGTAVHETTHPQWQYASVVTFQILENLGGVGGAKTVTVVFDERHRWSREPKLVAADKTDDGLYRHFYCGPGVVMPLDDPEIASFRRDIAARTPATVSLLIRSKPGYVPIPGVRVKLQGNGRSFEGVSSAGHELTFGNVPPGEYELTYSRANFSPAPSSRSITVLAGSRGTAPVYLESNSQACGRLVNASGEPVGDVRLLLRGAPRSLGGAPLLDWAMDQAKGLFTRRRQADAFFDTRAASDGVFCFAGVYPGWYRLSAELKDVDERNASRTREFYHPNVSGWEDATVFQVDEGQPVKEIVFRLAIAHARLSER